MKTGEFNNINSTIILCWTNLLNSPAAWKGFLDLSILSQKPCYVVNVHCHPYFHVLDKSIRMIVRINIVFEYILNIKQIKVCYSCWITFFVVPLFTFEFLNFCIILLSWYPLKFPDKSGWPIYLSEYTESA